MVKLYTVSLTCSNKLPENSVVISPDIYKHEGLITGQQLTLCVGSRKINVHCLGTHDSMPGSSLCMSGNVREQLLIPIPLTLKLLIEEEPNMWRLGPLIGIFANRYNKSLRPFGEQSRFFRKLSAAATNLNSFCFAFSPSDIDWDNKVVRGSVPPPEEDNEAKWQDLTLPFPDVIYDRGLFPKGEKRRIASTERKLLRNYPGIRFFNPAFFGKWKTHKLLSKHEVLTRHLPETKQYTSFSDIIELLQRHKTIYLKPVGGSSGKGIIRVSANGTQYAVTRRASKNVKTETLKTAADLKNYLTSLMGNIKYIAQQGLNLAKINGNPFDLRILMQRNNHGQWLRTGIAVRVAESGNYISNIHAGGHAAKLSAILPRAFPDLSLTAQIVKDVKRLCRIIACWISSEGHPLFGEVAVDLGVDEKGKTWIIELNAIPGRSVFRIIGASEVLSKAIRRPMEYACFISDFGPRRDEK